MDKADLVGVKLTKVRISYPGSVFWSMFYLSRATENPILAEAENINYVCVLLSNHPTLKMALPRYTHQLMM